MEGGDGVEEATGGTPGPRSEEEVRALIALLGDSSPTIWRSAWEELRKLPEPPPQLLRAAEAEPLELRIRARTLLEEMRVEAIAQRFATLAALPRHQDATALEEGCILLARYVYPQVDARWIRTQLDAWAALVASRARDEEGLEERLLHLDRLLFSELAFHGNQESYYDPQNSFLNRVIQRRTGIPISLSALYILIARRLGWPVHGVGLPGHFLVGCEPGLLIDPFHRGRRWQRGDCVAFLRRAGLPFRAAYLDPLPAVQILARMCNNLIAIYREAQEHGRLKALLGFRAALLRGDREGEE